MVSMILKYNGQERTLKEWAKIVGIGYSTITKRVRHGWSVDSILTRRPTNGYLGERHDHKEIENLLLLGMAAKRRKIYTQLKKDFEEIQRQHLKVA